jgi:hypothetical protein
MNLNLLVEKFPDGYDDSNIIRFRNAQNELIEVVEVHRRHHLLGKEQEACKRMEKFDEDDDLDSVIEPLIPVAGLMTMKMN